MVTAGGALRRLREGNSRFVSRIGSRRASLPGKLRFEMARGAESLSLCFLRAREQTAGVGRIYMYETSCWRLAP